MADYKHATDEEVEKDRLEILARLVKDRPELVQDFAPNSFGFHEALHTSSIVMEMFADYVLDHPSIVRDRALYLRANRVWDGLFDLYQNLGAAHLNPEE